MSWLSIIVYAITAVVITAIILSAIFVHLWWTLGIVALITMIAVLWIGPYGLLWPLYIGIGIVRLIGGSRLW